MRSLAALLAGALLPWTAANAAAPPALEEVVVTATLLPTAAFRVPASVTVLDSRDLRESAVQHLEEVLPQVPSLSWAGASSRPRYFQLRGVGELEQYQGAPNPSVGFLVDDIDFSGIGMVATLFDVEQVEVLRGPQGTRYGANALAGLIKVRTREPVPRRESGAEVSAGQDGLWSIGAVAGGGLYGDDDPRGAWRLAVQQSRSNGFRDNSYLGRSDTNGRDELTARGRLRLAAADGWRADLTVLYVDLANGYDAFAIDNSYATLSDRPGRDSQRSAGASLDLRHAGWGGLELTSVTSVADSDIESSFDGDWGNDRDWGDAGPYDFFSRTLRTRKTFSEDLRLAGVIDAGTHWIAGAWAQRLEESNDQRDDGLYLADTFERELSSRYRATSAALYGQVETRIADGLLLAGGLRGEQRDAVYEDSDGARFSPRDRMWGGHMSLSRELAERQRAYLSLSRGYKAGGFNIGASIPADRLQFSPEYLWNLEAGYKGQWPDRGLDAAVSVFYMRRLDQQVATSFQLDPQDPLTFVYYTDNAARGRAAGVEGQLGWAPSTAWEFSASASLMRSRYEDYSYGDRVLDGRDWAHAPHYKLAAAATWRHPAGWMARVDASAEDAFYFDASNDERSSAYALLGLRAGYAGRRWSVEGWVRNAFDRRHAVRGFYFGNEPPDFPPKLYVRLGDPRQAGITVRFNY